MAVYRSDQAQFTFAAEANPGGYPEIASGDNYTTSTTSATARPIYPGDKSIGVASASGIAAGTANQRFIVIGVDSKGETGITLGTMPSDNEVRRVVYVDGTEIHLDAPLAFPHKAGCQVKTITEASSSADIQGDLSGVVAGTAAAQTDKLITWVPGVYDTIDTPDPQEAMEPRYMLGQNTNRNAFQIYKGQQTFTGSVAGMVLLNGMPLRFPLGKVVTLPGTRSDLSSAKFYGQAGSTRGVIVVTGSAIALNAGDTIVINYTATPTATSTMEVRQIVGFSSPASSTTISGTTICQLNYPLFFDHVEDSTGTVGSVYGTSSPTAGNFTHHIFEQVDLSRVSWNVNVKDEDGANAFQRRYYGGLIGGMTISAEEGGLLTCGWDTATFLGMVHNIQDAARSSAPLRRFAGMHDIAKTDIGSPLFPAAAASEIGDRGLPSTEPYYFSEGNIKMWGQTVARVRNFTINVTNGEEVRYYIRRADPDNRGPFEVRPGQRGYTMSATIGLPDAGTTGLAMRDKDQMSLWKELLMSGEYTVASSSSNTGHVGFNIELQFTRGTNDTLTIRIPNDYDGSDEGTGSSLASQGAFIQTAPVPIDGAVPMEQSADIIFKSMKIEIADQEPFYP